MDIMNDLIFSMIHKSLKIKQMVNEMFLSVVLLKN